MTYQEPQYEGWGAFDATSVKGNFRYFQYEPKKWCEDDIELKIKYCGVCGSDLHTASSGWGDMSKMYPQVVGHEIVGEVIRVGKEVKNVKVGELWGVGAQCDSCQECENCNAGKEPYCNKGLVGTYGAVFSRNTAAKGDKSYGGYANYWRGPSRFCVKIPDELDPADAAPMLCGATTVYSPLKQYGAGTKAKDVGVIGIGGLGHFGVIFAAAMGANVTAISHGSSKIDDAKKMGASKVIVTGDDAAAAVKEYRRSLDLIICSTNDPNMPLSAYLSLLRTGGHFVLVGIAETDKIPDIHPLQLISNNVHITGSLIGAPATIEEVLDFAAKHNIKPWIQKYPMSAVNEAIPSMEKGNARYRYVLVNEENGGQL